MKKLSDEDYISLICNGEFDAIPNFPIGELFESFFDNINYNVLKKGNDNFVDFTGDAICDNEPCTILIRFKVEEMAEEFEIIEVKVDDEVLNENEILDLLEDIAYVGGAVIDDTYYECTHNCNDCENINCDNMEYDDIDEDYDDTDEDNEDDE